jgi:hypothetical protein
VGAWGTVADLKRASRGRPAPSARRDRPSRLTAVQVAQHVRRALGEITGLEAECVTALEPHEDGRWKATVEVLELPRIPETDDVLGTYEALVDAAGEVVRYQRVRRYARSRSLQEGAR